MTLYFHPTIKVTKKGKTSTRRATVAGVPAVVDGRTSLRLGIAICSAKDQFVKKVGRAKAEGRALSEKGTIINAPMEHDAQLNVFLTAAIAGITNLGYEVLPKPGRRYVLDNVHYYGY